MGSIDKRDIHILKYYSALVSISNGRVINVTDPVLLFCPLAKHLYQEFRGMRSNDKETIKNAIKGAIESKIRDYGLFTGKRKLNSTDVSIPYGASEMLMFALRKKMIDAAVVVCDGAGTVITSKPALVQGIGARLNSLLLTTPIPGIIKKLKIAGGQVIFKDAHIDQYQGVKKAITAGYKTIAVTISAHASEDLKRLRLLEKKHNVKIISLVVCTTGITRDKIALIRDYADLVWSCASHDIRQIIGPIAILQLSRQIPVFVLTHKGVNFVSAYANESEMIKKIDLHKQYLIDHVHSKRCVYLGGFKAFISLSNLPVSGRREPSFKDTI